MEALLVVLYTFLGIFAFFFIFGLLIYIVISEYILYKNGGDPYGNCWKTDFGPNGELPKMNHKKICIK